MGFFFKKKKKEKRKKKKSNGRERGQKNRIIRIDREIWTLFISYLWFGVCGDGRIRKRIKFVSELFFFLTTKC